MDWQQSYYTGISGQDPEDHTTWEPINAYPDLDGDNRQDPIYTRFQLAEDPTLVGLPVDADDEEIERPTAVSSPASRRRLEAGTPHSWVR